MIMETRELALKLFDEQNPVLMLTTCGELDRNQHMARYDKIANAYLAGFVKGVEACIVKGCEYGVGQPPSSAAESDGKNADVVQKRKSASK